MPRNDRKVEEDEDGLGTLLFGGAKPQIKDLADPKKRKQAIRMAKMMGFEIRRDQMIRIGIGVAVVMVVLLIGLWAIARVFGLLFWAVIALAACALVVRALRPRAVKPSEIPARPAMPIEDDRKSLESWDREAEARADKALEDLEKRLKE